jgi:hypothetical protein
MEVFVLVLVTVSVTVLETVFDTVCVQLAFGSPKEMPLLPMPDHSQRPIWPTSRQERLPSSQSAPTSL